MSHNLFIKSKNIVALFTIAAVLFGSLVVTAPRVQADESSDQMSELIQSLLKQITVLQAKLQQMRSPEGGFGTQLSVGDGVITTGTLKVRREAMIVENVLVIIPASVRGTIVDGPKTAGGYTWWKVNYASGVTGWSAANWLKETAVASVEASKETDGDTEVVPLSVKLISPTSGTYTYGDKVTITWTQTGEVPKGSQACVVLRNTSTYKEYAFPPEGGCVPIAGAEPQTSVFGTITRTSGYDLVPGNYRAKVRIIGPSIPGGKDGGVLAVAKDVGTFTIKEESVTSYKIDITSPIDYTSVNPGDTVTLKWNQTNLSGYQGHVEFTGDGAPQRHLNTGFDLSTGMVDVKIPVSDNFGVVAPGAYLLKLRTINVKDGSAQDVGDSIKIDIGEAKQNFKAAIGSTLLTKVYSVTRNVAEGLCRESYTDTVRDNPGAVTSLKCYWGGAEFAISEMKG